MARPKLLMIPGPSPVVPRVLEALALPTVSHVSREMAEDLSQSCSNLKKIVFAQKGEPFVIAGAGTLAMEIAVVNLTAPGEKVLVVSQGYFGRRMAEVCAAFGFGHEVIEKDWGRVIPAEELERKLSGGGFAVVAATHVDTATGVCAPVEDYARVAKKSGALFIVDGVCATGGVPERMDDWGIDCVLTAAQKCFGAPPGLAVLVFSEKAMEKRRGLPSVPAYYSDIIRWLPVMRDPYRYFSTPCVNEVRAFAEATRIMLEEGLEARFARHRLQAAAVRAGLTALDLKLFTDENALAPTLSVVLYPEGIADTDFRAKLLDNGVVVAGGLGPTAGRVFRMGHMGNLTDDDVLFAVEALASTLAALGKPDSRREAVEAARAVFKSRSA